MGSRCLFACRPSRSWSQACATRSREEEQQESPGRRFTPVLLGASKLRASRSVEWSQLRIRSHHSPCRGGHQGCLLAEAPVSRVTPPSVTSKGTDHRDYRSRGAQHTASGPHYRIKIRQVKTTNSIYKHSVRWILFKTCEIGQAFTLGARLIKPIGKHLLWGPKLNG